MNRRKGRKATARNTVKVVRSFVRSFRIVANINITWEIDLSASLNISIYGRKNCRIVRHLLHEYLCEKFLHVTNVPCFTFFFASDERIAWNERSCYQTGRSRQPTVWVSKNSHLVDFLVIKIFLNTTASKSLSGAHRQFDPSFWKHCLDARIR